MALTRIRDNPIHIKISATLFQSLDPNDYVSTKWVAAIYPMVNQYVFDTSKVILYFKNKEDLISFQLKNL